MSRTIGPAERMRPLNRHGIPVFNEKTIRVLAAIWDGDFNFKPVDTYIKYRQK